MIPTTRNTLGTVTMEPVTNTDQWLVVRRDGSRVTRTAPMSHGAAQRVYESLGGYCDPNECGRCNGDGAIAGRIGPQTCPACRGSGLSSAGEAGLRRATW